MAEDVRPEDHRTSLPLPLAHWCHLYQIPSQCGREHGWESHGEGERRGATLKKNFDAKFVWLNKQHTTFVRNYSTPLQHLAVFLIVVAWIKLPLLQGPSIFVLPHPNMLLSTCNISGFIHLSCQVIPVRCAHTFSDPFRRRVDNGRLSDERGGFNGIGGF